MSRTSPAEFYDFVLAYFGKRVSRHRQESSHFVVDVSDLPDNISIPGNRNPLPDGTLRQLLRKCGLSYPQFNELAGTPDRLKSFLKAARDRPDSGGDS